MSFGIIEKTKPIKKSNIGDCNHAARLRRESRIAGGESKVYSNGYERINWNSKKRSK